MKLISIGLLICLVVMAQPVIATQTYEEFYTNDTWVCPDGVYTASLTMIGGGQGGSGGGYAYFYNGNWYGYAIIGVGGAAGETLEYTNISVVPGTAYDLVIGNPGIGGSKFGHIVTTDQTYTYNGSAGGTTSAFGYNASGGSGNSVDIVCSSSTHYCTYTNTSGLSSGEDGIGSYLLAEDGSVGSYSNGGDSGYGFGAGGGGGGAGYKPIGSSALYGGDGGDGAIGMVRIGYDTTSTTASINGYVNDAKNATTISGATVSATQAGLTTTDTTDANGYYEFPSLTYGLLVTIDTTMSGYESSVVTFVPPIPSAFSLNQTIGTTTPDITVASVGRTVRDSFFKRPLNGATLYASNSTAELSAVANNAGYAYIELVEDESYTVWASYHGYNSTSEIVTITGED